MLLNSLAHSEQLQLLRDGSVLSALIPFFPLFKVHVKECAEVQLSFRRRYWLAQGQLSNFSWDASVLSYAASQLKYQGPISLYGCKNIHEILTHVLLAHLTRTFRRLDEEEQVRIDEMMRDRSVSTARKFLSYGANLLRKARNVFTGPEWNYAHANVSVSIDQQAEEIVFDIVQPAPPGAAASSAGGAAAAAGKAKVPAGAATGASSTASSSTSNVVRSEIRRSLHAHAHAHSNFQSEPGIARPGPNKHRHITEEGNVADEQPPSVAKTALKEDL
jgi:hypothetical protein